MEEVGDIVVKLNDSYLGIGDSFWRRGTDFNTFDDIQENMKKQYQGQEALLLDLVRPHPDHGVHSFDIVTIRTPDDGV